MSEALPVPKINPNRSNDVDGIISNGNISQEFNQIAILQGNLGHVTRSFPTTYKRIGFIEAV